MSEAQKNVEKLRNLPEDTTTVLVDGDIGSIVQGYDDTLLNEADIGVLVQAYDVDTTKNDVNNEFSVAQRGDISSVAYAASIALDMATSNFFEIGTPTGAITFANPTNKPASTVGQGGFIQIPTSAYDGSHTWGTDYVNVPTLSGATSHYTIPYVFDGTNIILNDPVVV